MGPHPLQPRQGVLELRQLDLQLRLVGAGAGGEDVEDQLAAVDDLDARAAFSRLRIWAGAEVVVEDDHVGLVGLDELLELLDLARADVGGDVDLLPLLQQLPTT